MSVHEVHSKGDSDLAEATLKAPGFNAHRFADKLQEHGLDALVVTSPENVYYITGYPTLPSSGNPILYSLRNVLPFGAVVGPSGQRTLTCWGFSLQGVDIDVEHVVGFNQREEALGALVEAVSDVLPAGRSTRARLGVEAGIAYEVVQRIKAALPGVELCVADQAMRALRRVKSEAEKSLLRSSVGIAEGALERIFAELKLGSSRLEMIALAKQAVIELGGDGVGHVTMSFGHANPEIAIDEVLGAGDLVVVDVGAKLRGYTSDCRRYAYAGEVPALVGQRHREMCGIVDAVGDALRPGVSFSRLVGLAREGFEQVGIAVLGRFTHVGHGIGLETEEEWIDDDPSTVIEEGMVVAIELYADAEPYGVIGDEETYVIGATGAQQVSKLDVSLRRI